MQMQMEMEMDEQRDSNPDGIEMDEQRDSNPDRMEMDMEEQRDSNLDGVEMDMEGQRDFNPDGVDSNPGEMEMEEQRYLNPDELVAVKALLELGRVIETGYFVTWGRKRRRSRGVYSSCNSGDATTAPPEATAVAACVKPAQGSPITPLRWSGNDKVSAPGSTSSDSAAAPAPRPCDCPLQFKVEKKLGVHKPPIGKGPKKKTLAELKEVLIGLSSDREEMEKEKEKLLNRLQSLRDDNILLKRELALKLSTKVEPQLSVQSLTVSLGLPSLELSLEPDAESSKNLVMNSSSTAAVGWYSNDSNWGGKSLRDSLAPTKSCSNAFVLPDLNMPPEDVEDLSENQVVQTNSKAIVAAEARKYRMECIRLKHSQAVKVQIR